MALVFSPIINNNLPHKPFSSHINPRNPNPPVLSVNPKRQFVLSSPKFRKCHRPFRILNGLGKDSNQNIVEDEDDDNIGVKAALSMLRFYKREISPLMPNSCRYLPTCSEYSMIAYKKYGVVKGSILTAWRLCRCNPLGGSGFDPPRWFDEESPPER